MAEELHCWRCGESLQILSLPLSREAECPACLNYVHVCRMCVYFDADLAKSCSEDDAEEVKEKERPNFCDYFKPSAGAWDEAGAAAQVAAHEQLGNLFGDDAFATNVVNVGDDSDEDTLNEANDLFDTKD
jgi:hypothetical protein